MLAKPSHIAHNGAMRVLHDEVPDDDDFDAGRRRGEFDNITPDDLIHGADGNPPGWLDARDIERARKQMPIVYVQVIPVQTDDLGRAVRIGTLLSIDESEEEGLTGVNIGDAEGVKRTIVSGRILFHESIREAIARNISKDLGELALPQLPLSLQPFTIAQYFPTPGVSECYDPRQHAVALCYVVPIAGDCKPSDETLEVEWTRPEVVASTEFLQTLENGQAIVLRRALAWLGTEE